MLLSLTVVAQSVKHLRLKLLLEEVVNLECPVCEDYIPVVRDIIDLSRTPIRGAHLLDEETPRDTDRYYFAEHTDPSTGVRCSHSGQEADKQEVEDIRRKMLETPLEWRWI